MKKLRKLTCHFLCWFLFTCFCLFVLSDSYGRLLSQPCHQWLRLLSSSTVLVVDYAQRDSDMILFSQLYANLRLCYFNSSFLSLISPSLHLLLIIKLCGLQISTLTRAFYLKIAHLAWLACSNKAVLSARNNFPTPLCKKWLSSNFLKSLERNQTQAKVGRQSKLARRKWGWVFPVDKTFCSQDAPIRLSKWAIF